MTTTVKGRRVGWVALIVFAFCAAVIPVAAGAAPKALLSTIGSSGSAGGQFNQARGVAVNQATGSSYVADGANNRVQQFTAAGSFIRAWGTDVIVAGAPNDNGTGFEICDTTAAIPNTPAQCKAGTTALGIAGQVAQPMGVAVDQANGYVYVTSNTNRRVDVFSGFGAFAGSFGWGVDTGAAALEVCTTASSCQIGTAGSGAGQFPAALIASTPALDPTAAPGTIYVPEQGNARVSKFAITVSGGSLQAASFLKAFGWDVAPGAVNEEQEIRIRAGAGQFTLTFGADSTANLPYNESPANVQAALNALPSINGGGGSVSVTGGPGDPSGSSLYVVRFDGGPLAGTDVAQLSAASGTTPLSGGSPASGVSVATRAIGGTTTGLESCTTTSGCKVGAIGGGSGQFTGSTGSPTSAAVDSSGAIYVVSGPYNNPANDCTLNAPCRIQKFNPSASAAVDFGPLNTTSLDSGTVACLDVAVDPSNDHVFLNCKTGATTYRVPEYDSTGMLVETHPAGSLTSGSATINHGLAIGTEGRLYSGLTGTSIYLLGPVPDPTPTISPVTEVGISTATFNGVVDIPAPGAPAFITKFHFEYSKNGVNWASVPAFDQNVGDGSTGSHDVEVDVGGLDPNTSYCVRLAATSGNEDVLSDDTTCFTTGTTLPQATLTYTEDVTQATASLGAHIDPQGSATAYHFEWSTREAWEQTGEYENRVPAFERQIGSGNEMVIVKDEIGGLSPASEYVFRVVATSSEGTTEGPDEAFETLNPCGLTDGRCYELVSPADKGPVGAAGDLVALGQELQFQAAPEGPAIAYSMAYGLPDATAGNEVVYRALRNGDGWSSTQLSAPALEPPKGLGGGTPSAALSLNPDLSCGAFSSTQALTDDAPLAALDAGQANLYTRNAVEGWTVVSNLDPSVIPPPTDPPLSGYDVVGISESGSGGPCSRVVFRSKFQYPGVPGSGQQRLYVWEDATIYNVGRIPGPGGNEIVQTVPGASQDPDHPADMGSQQTGNSWNAVSNDASRIFFTALSKLGGDLGQQAVFVRDHASGTGDLSSGSTLVANVADSTGAFAVGQEVSGSGIAPATTIVSVDQSEAELVLSQPATADASAAALRAVRSVDVSQSQAAALPEGAPNNDDSVYQTASDDGSEVFFLARYGLAQAGGSVKSSKGASTCVVSNGSGCDLYRYSVDTGVLTDLSADTNPADSAGAGVVGVLGASADGEYVYFAARGQLVPGEGSTAAENLADGTYSVYLTHGGSTEYVGRLRGATMGEALIRSSQGVWSSRVTPDGQHLLFVSSAQVTDYDSGGRIEAYLYDAGAETTVCVSCRRDGLPSIAPLEEIPLVNGVNVENAASPPRTLTADGSRVFFVSSNPLAHGATAGRPSLYQWENGQISFLGKSAPSGSNPKYELRYAGASATGDDVYFTTVDHLTWQDTDGKLDIYDARVGGGFAQPSAPPAPCDPLGESSCQGAPGAGGGAVQVPGSSNFVGPGNEKSEPAKKKGKKKKSKKNKTGKKKGKGGKKTARNAKNNGRAAK